MISQFDQGYEGNINGNDDLGKNAGSIANWLDDFYSCILSGTVALQWNRLPKNIPR
jgi:hypothetical protein